MEAVLKSSELLGLIFSNFDSSERELTTLQKSNLRNCLLVSNCWWRAAVALLWRHANASDIITLCNVFHSDADPQLRTLSRFSAYSRYVTKLSVALPTVSGREAFLKDLALLAEPTPLFPALRDVHFRIRRSVSLGDMAFAAVFFHSTLETLTLLVVWSDFRESSLEFFLNALSRRCTQLYGLTIDLSGQSAHRNILHHALSLFGKLRRIIIHPSLVDRTVLSTLSSLKSLEYFGVSSFMAERSSILENSYVSQTQLLHEPNIACNGWSKCTNLRHLRLTLDSEVITALLSSVFAASPLQSLDLRVLLIRGTATCNVIPQSICTSDEVHEVKVCFEKVRNSMWTLEPASLDWLRMFGNVVKIEIRHPCSISLNDNEIVSIMRNCPKLRTLVLNPSPHHCLEAFAPAMSINAVKGICEVCRDLRHLSICVSPHLPAPNMFAFCSLDSLDLGLSFIDAPDTDEWTSQISIFLTRLLLPSCTVKYTDLDQASCFEALSQALRSRAKAKWAKNIADLRKCIHAIRLLQSQSA